MKKRILIPLLVSASLIYYGGWGKRHFYSPKKQYQQVMIQEKDLYTDIKKDTELLITEENISLLENLIESDLSHLMSKAVDASRPTFYEDLYKGVVLAKKGNLKIAGFLLYPPYLKDDELVMYISKGIGPDLLNELVPELFSKLVPGGLETLYNSCKSSVSKEEWTKKFLEKNPQLKESWYKNQADYVAYVSGTAGATINIFFTHEIKLKDPGSLYYLVMAWGHEIGHTLIDHEVGLLQFFVDRLGAINRSSYYLNDKMKLVETACDIIGEQVAQHFLNTHVKKDSLLYQRFQKDMTTCSTTQKIIAKKVKEIDKCFQENNLKLAYELIEELNKGRKNLPLLNEAFLSIMKLYSCDEQIEKELNFIADKLGMKRFIELVADMNTEGDVHKAYEKVLGQ